MNKNDSYKNTQALRRTLESQNFDCAPNGLSLRVSNERYAKDATFEQQLSPEDRRMLKDMGVAV